MPVDEDPGWGTPRDILLTVLLPTVGMRRERDDQLVFLRLVFLTFVSLLVMIGVLSLFIVSGDATDGMAAVAVVVAAVGVGGQLVGWRLGRLDCSSPEALALSYRQRFFVRVAVLNAGSLAAFVGTMLTHSVVPYAVGGLLALVGYLRLAPTAGRLRQEQQRLQRHGCEHSLVQALRT